MDRYENLANAIIVQACRDYEEEYYRDDVEVFLKGEWFKTITDLDGETILKELKNRVIDKKLEKEEKEKRIEKIRRKRGY